MEHSKSQAQVPSRSNPDEAATSRNHPEEASHGGDGRRLPFPVVTIGALEGGLSALERFFRALPPAPGMAFVLIRHPTSALPSGLVEHLRTCTPMQVRPARGTDTIRENCVYVVPPGMQFAIQNGELHLRLTHEEQDLPVSIARPAPSSPEDEAGEDRIPVAEDTRAPARRHEQTLGLIGQTPGLSVDHFRTALKNAPIVVFNQDRSLRYTWVHSASPLSPITEAAVGQHDEELFPENMTLRQLNAFKREVMQRRRGGRQEVALHVNNEMRYFDVTVEPMLDDGGDVVGITGAAADVTVSHQLNDQLQALNAILEERVALKSAQVHSLASDLTLAEQRERDRIAQMLHDHLQQLLHGVQIRLGVLNATRHTRTPDALHDQVTAILPLVQEAIHTTRSLSVDLSPPVLKTNDLAFTLLWLADHMHEVHRLRVRVLAGHPVPVHKPEHRILLYQIARELLFNVVKHAKVGEAVLATEQSPEALVLRVEDQGVGFVGSTLQEETESTGSFGLPSIRTRLHRIDGTMQIVSAPGTGTRITIKIPAETLSAPTDAPNER